MDKILFFDTNALLTLQEKVFSEHFIISQKTLEEIEHIKVSASKDAEIKYKARKCARLLDENYGSYDVVLTTDDILNQISCFKLEITPDSIIISAALFYQTQNNQDLIFVTDDVNAKCLAREAFGLLVKSSKELNLVTDQPIYTGYKDVTLSDDEMSNFYCNLGFNKFNCMINEYLIIRKSDGEIVDYRRWNGTEFVALSYKQISSRYLGKVKPRNPQQVLAFDMLQNKTQTIKVISGRFGSGKDFIMISNALKMIEDGKFEKLLYIRNAVSVKDANEIGFLPGSKDEKLRPYAMVLADHLGGETGLEMQIMAGTIEIEHLGFIRGRDIKNTIIYCSEAENLTKEHVQLLMGRVGEGSVLWMNGDFKQTDSPIFKMNSGLLSAVSKLSGHEKFGYIQLEKTERSETAAMADLLD